MSDLKPCPFCGEAAETWVDPSHSKAVFFGCRVEDCCGEMHWLPTEAEAIAAWDRRAPAPHEAVMAQMAEALRAMVDFHNGPTEAKRPDVFVLRMMAQERALAAYDKLKGERG